MKGTEEPMAKKGENIMRDVIPNSKSNKKSERTPKGSSASEVISDNSDDQLPLMNNKSMQEPPIKNLQAAAILRRAKHRIRGVLIFSRVSKEITAFGTNSTIMRAFIYQMKLKNCLEVEDEPQKALATRSKNLGCLFNPTSNLIHVWNLIVVLLLVYVCIGTPWLIAFEDLEFPSKFFFLELCVDLLFLCDIFVTLNTAIIFRDKLITNRKQIFYKYLRGFLIIDIIAIFPFFLFDGERSNSLVRIVRITKISRLIRASKIFKVIKPLTTAEWLEDFFRFITTFSGITRLFLSLLLMIFMAHITACMWYYTSRIDEFGPDTWVVRNGFVDQEKGQLYLISLYWALTILTTVGFGDIHAVTSLEMSLCIIWLVFGIGFYTFLVGTVASVLSKIDAKNSMLNEHLQDLEQLAQDYELPDGMLKKMKRELKYVTTHRVMQREDRIEKLGMLSKGLRQSICLSMHKAAAQNVQFLREQDCIFIINVVPQLIYEKVESGSFIYKEGEHPDAVYFIVSGRVNCIIEETQMVFKRIVGGGYFGEIEFIKETMREFSVAASEFCTFLVMKKKLFHEVMSQYGKVADQFTENAKHKDEKNKQALNDMFKIIEKSADETERSKSETKKNLIMKKKSLLLGSPDVPKFSKIKTEIFRQNPEALIWMHSQLQLMTSTIEDYIYTNQV